MEESKAGPEAEPLVGGASSSGGDPVALGGGRRRRNPAQTRLKLFVGMVLLLVFGAALPFALKSTFFRGESLVAVAELAACGVSFVCCAIIFRSYRDGPRAYRRHPNRLIVLKTACDGGLNLVVVGAVVYLAACRCNSQTLALHQMRRQACFVRGYLSACDDAKAMPFATQLFATSSEAWFFVLLLDLRRSVRNPFYSFESSRALYRPRVENTTELGRPTISSRSPP